MIDDITQRTLKLSGTQWEVIRNSEVVGTVLGHYVAQSQRFPNAYILLLSDADVIAHDLLKCTVTNRQFVIERTEIQTFSGERNGMHAFTRESIRSAPLPTQTFTIHANYGNVGNITIDNQTQHFDFTAVETQIIERGVDVAELQEFLSVLKRECESGTVRQGALAKFGDVVKRSDWIIEPIASAMIGFLFKSATGI